MTVEVVLALMVSVVNVAYFASRRRRARLEREANADLTSTSLSSSALASPRPLAVQGGTPRLTYSIEEHEHAVEKREDQRASETDVPPLSSAGKGEGH